ncbi:MAG: hypothetical protein ABJC33_11180 [Betaproteobacteria bacterium]
MHRIRNHLLAPLVAIAFCAAALPTPVSAAEETAVITVPRHNCKKPEFPGRLASDLQKRVWRKDVDAYSECIKQFAAEQQKNADLLVKAANAAIEEYNAAVKEFQQEMSKAAG